MRLIFFISFSDPALEKRFLEAQQKDNLPFNRMVAIAGIVAVSGFYLLNHLLVPPQNDLLYWIPYFISLVALCISIVITFQGMSHRFHNASGLVVVFIINVAPLVSLMSNRYPDSLYFYCGCVVLLTTGLIFIRLSFYYIAVFVLFYVLAFEALYFGSGPHPMVQTWIIHYIFALAIGVGLTVSYRMELRERTNFVKLRIIIEERIKLSRLRDARPGAGGKKP